MKLYKILSLKKGSLAAFVFPPWQELEVPVLWKSWLSGVCGTLDPFWVFLWSQTSAELIGFFRPERFGKNTAERIKGSGLYCFVSGGCILQCPIKGIHQGQHMVLSRLLWNEQEMGSMPLASWVKATTWHKALHISFLSKFFSIISKHIWLSLSLLLLKKRSFLEKHDHLCPAGWVFSVLRRWGLYSSEQQQQNLFLSGGPGIPFLWQQGLCFLSLGVVLSLRHVWLHPFGFLLSVAGFIDSLIYHSARAIQKKIELGKTT